MEKLKEFEHKIKDQLEENLKGVELQKITIIKEEVLCELKQGVNLEERENDNVEMILA